MINNEAAKATIDEIGVGPRAREGDHQIFERNCLNWISSWISSNNKDSINQEACVFLYDPNTPPSDLLEGAKHQYLFNSSFPSSLAGNAYACSSVMNTVFQKPVPKADVPEIITWLQENSLDRCFVILFLPRILKAFIKPLDVPINSEEVFSELQFRHQSDRQPFDLHQLDNVLDFFYTSCVETHRGNCRIWKNQKIRELVNDPEDMVQRSLHQTLLTHIDYRGIGVTKIEVYNTQGRKDIEIIVHRNGEFAMGIIELKVLFPDYSENKNLEWAKSGVDQIVKYRNGTPLHKVERGFACLYDGRKKDQPMPEFFEYAQKESVEGRRYFMTTEGVDREINSIKQ